MSPRLKLLLGIAFVATVVAAFYLYGRRLRRERLVEGRSPIAKKAGSLPEIKRIPDPVIILLLDVSSSLIGQDGNDPHNRERAATEAFLRVLHHFSSPGMNGFSPQVGIVTFGARPQWITLKGKRIWQLRNKADLGLAMAGVDIGLGTTNENDRRRGTYTDFNGALHEALGALKEMESSGPALVMMMTDGDHRPYPGNPWNYAKDKFPFDLSVFFSEEKATTLEAIESIKNRIPESLRDDYVELLQRMRSLDFKQVEPLEYLLRLAAEAEQRDEGEPPQGRQDGSVDSIFGRAATEVRTSAVRKIVQQSKKETTLKEATARLLEFYIPEIAKLASFRMIGLSGGTPRQSMRNDLEKMIKTSGEPPSALRWCDDAGLLQEFLAIFQEWLVLLEQKQPADEIIGVGGKVQSLAVAVQVPGETGTTVRLIGPKGEASEPTAVEAGLNLFLVRQPVAGKYRLETDSVPLTGTVRVLMQTDPLFHAFSLSDQARLGGEPPAARITAFSTETGLRVELHKEFADPILDLVGDLLDESGTSLRTVRWQPRKNSDDKVIDYELTRDFWTPQLASRPGRYVIRTKLQGLKYQEGGKPVTPRTLEFAFTVEPTVVFTAHDAEGFEHKKFDFPPRSLHLNGD